MERLNPDRIESGHNSNFERKWGYLWWNNEEQLETCREEIGK